MAATSYFPVTRMFAEVSSRKRLPRLCSRMRGLHPIPFWRIARQSVLRASLHCALRRVATRLELAPKQILWYDDR